MHVLFAWHRYPLLPEERHLTLVRQDFRPTRPYCPLRTTYLVSLTVTEVKRKLAPIARHPVYDMPTYLIECSANPEFSRRGRMKVWIAHDLSMVEPVIHPWQRPQQRWPHLRPVDVEIDSLAEIPAIIAA